MNLKSNRITVVRMDHWGPNHPQDTWTYPKKGPVTKIVGSTEEPELVKEQVRPGDSALICKEQMKTMVRYSLS